MNQISVFLENKTGAMADVSRVLAENSINMRAMSLAESEGFGIARIIVDDVYKATTVLKDAGFIYNMVPVVTASIPDEPGGLLKVLEILKEGSIGVEYMYAFMSSSGERANMVFKVDDVQNTENYLKGKGIAIG